MLKPDSYKCKETFSPESFHLNLRIFFQTSCEKFSASVVNTAFYVSKRTIWAKNFEKTEIY